MFVQFLCLISLIYVDSTVQICFISHSYLINGTFPYGCITVVYNYILGQLILHNCVLTISENSLYTLYSLNVDTMFIPLYSPLNLYLIILWILDFKYILLLLLNCRIFFITLKILIKKQCWHLCYQPTIFLEVNLQF